MLLKENNPWLGLESYSTEDASRFFGRDSDVDVVSNAIYDNFITTIYGISGAGKTSLLNAGLTPALKAHNFLPIRIRLKHNTAVSYEDQIIESICNAIESTGGEVEYETGLSIGNIPENEKLWFFLHSRRFWSHTNFPIRPVIFIDQFEEIFTQNEDTEVISDFFHSINAIQFDTPPAITKEILDSCSEYQDLNDNTSRMVFIIREDFLARLEDYAYGIAALRRNRIGVKRMNGLQALEVIMNPVPGLVSHEGAMKILTKVSGKNVIDSPYSLERLSIDTSILSLFCSEIYQRACDKENDVISDRIIEELGNDIISQFYIENMSHVPADLVEYIEKHLLTSSGFRNSVALEDIEIPKMSKDDLLSKLSFLAKKRILRIEESDGVERVEFTHDILCKVAKHHRDHRKEGMQQKRHLRNSGLRIFDFLVLLFFSAKIINDMSPQSMPLYSKLSVEWISSVLIFAFLFISGTTETNKYWKMAGSIFLTFILLDPPLLMTSHSSWALPLLLLLSSTILAFFSFVKRNSRSGIFMKALFVLLTVLAVRYSLNACLATLILVSTLVLAPYRHSDDGNSLTFSIAASFILLVCMILLGMHELILFAFYPSLTAIISKKKPSSKSMHESLQSCFRCEIYRTYPLFKYLLFIYVIVILIFACKEFWTSMLDENIYYVPFVSALMFCILFESARAVYGRFGEITNEGLDERFIKGTLISGVAAFLIMLCQYIPFGWVCMTLIFFATYALMRRTSLSLNLLKQDLKCKALCFGIIVISIYLVPTVSIGYPLFNNGQYARVPFRNFNINELMVITDRNGNHGVRDRYNIIVPVAFSEDISIRTQGLDFGSEDVPSIVFVLKDRNSGERLLWDCSNHMDMDNTCTRTILESIVDNTNERYDEISAYECACLLESAGRDASSYARKQIFNCFRRYLSSDYVIYDIDDIRMNIEKFSPYSIEQALNKSLKLLKFVNDREFITLLLDDLYGKCLKADSKPYESWEHYTTVAGHYLSAGFWDKAIEYADKAIDKDPSLTYAYRYKIEAYILSDRIDEAQQLLERYGTEMLYQGKIYDEITDTEERIIYGQSDSTSVLLRYDNIHNAIAGRLAYYESAGLIRDVRSPEYIAFKETVKSEKTAGTYDSAEDRGNYYLCRKYNSYNGPKGEFTEGGHHYEWEDALDYQFYMSKNGEVSPYFKRHAEGIDEDILLIIDEKTHHRRYIDRTNDTIRVINGEFDHAWRFSEGLAAVVKDDMIGFIRKDGGYAIEPAFRYRHTPPEDNEAGHHLAKEYNLPSCNAVDVVFQHGLCPIQHETGPIGIINRNGKWVLEPAYDNVVYNAGIGMWIIEKEVDGKTLLGAMNTEGEMIYDVEFDQILYSADGLSMWGKDDIYRYIHDGKEESLIYLKDDGIMMWFRNMADNLQVYTDLTKYL